jgi:hypothetical protein
MERIGEEVRRSLAHAGAPDADGLAAVTDAWPDAVGPAIARAAWPLRIARDGTLHVAAVSSIWAFELGRLEAELRGRLATTLGDHAPPALRFAPGPVPEPARADASGPKAPMPTAEEAAAARRLAAAIADDDLRETIRRAAEASLATHRSGRPFW